ncbi:MAG TPA: FG-GAP-like repeat-containing protein [Candidatus Peribacteraceae bacterium]|nr:FG-GAP-like repeat-containing protein [Candidatus Peribacteraceae bacterium]
MDFFSLHRRHSEKRARLTQSMHKLVAVVTMVMTIVQAAGADGSSAVFAVPQAHAATGIFAPINYQGKISAINGTAVADGKYNMRFKIFNTATGGTPLWTETWDSTTQQVTMTGGLFSVALGSQVAMTGSVNFNTDNLYLQVEFDPSNNSSYPEVFSPRRRFGSVPYAHNADTIDGLDSSKFIRKDQSETASGTLTIKPNDASKIGLDILSTGGTSASPGLRISTNGAPDIVFGSGGTNYDVNLYRFTANVLKTDDSLYVAGALSGSTVHAEKSLTTSGTLVFEGAASGSNLYLGTSLKGAGLTDCSTGGTSKLLWNSSTGRFSCGTDQSGGLNSTGQVLTIGDARYVKKSGDTMTGALNIRPTAGSSIVGLNVAATMSGRNLVVEGSGANPLIYTTGGYVGLGTSTPGAALTFVSHNTTLDPDILFQKDSGFLLYTSDVYSSVNAVQSPQWITRRARGTSASPLAVQNGDQLGLFGFRGYTGTGFSQRAWINAIVDGTVTTAGKVPTALTFGTSPDTNEPVERMRITSSGSIGIGTNAPGSKLSVSGSVIIGKNVGSAAADANVGLEVLSTISGSTVYATNALRSSGSIVAEGTISGANLFVGTSIKGAGLTSCSNSATSKLLWNSTTGRFSCGTDQSSSFSSGNVITIGDARYVKKSGDTMTGALVINVTNGSLGTIGLKVINTLSGAIIHAEKQLTSSGVIVGKQSGVSTGSGVLTIANTTRYGTGAYIFASGSDLALDSNHSNAHIAPNILFGYKGNFDTNLYRFAASILKTDGSLYVTNTLSGAVVHANSSLSSSGTLTVHGIARFQNNVNVVGTVSGSTIYAINSLRSSGSIVAEGTISGANLFVGTSIKGAGLTNCNSSNSALQWNSSTGRFSCGTISVGTTFSTGQVITIGDARYVKKSGDTMTGALNIRPTAGSNTLGLNVAATMSGRALTIEGTGSVPLLSTSVTRGGLVMGTQTGSAIQPQLNITGRLHPPLVGSGSTSGYGQTIAIQGNRAYVGSELNKVDAIDITNPLKPTLLGSVGGIGYSYGMAAAGQYLYSLNNLDLNIYDISGEGVPVLISTTRPASPGLSIAVQGRYAYITEGSGTLVTYDVSNPVHPVMTGSGSTGNDPLTVVVNGRYAYVSNYYGKSVQIFDLKNPANPSLVSTISTSHFVYTVASQGRYLYATEQGAPDYLQIFDVSNPSSPTTVSTSQIINDPGNYMVVQGRYVYISQANAGTIQSVDVSNPASPVLTSTIKMAAGSTPEQIAVKGRYLYATQLISPATIQVYDLGGEYVQQMEAGGIETETLSVRTTIQGMDASLQGATTIGRSLEVNGGASFGSGGQVIIGGYTGVVLNVRGTISGSTVIAENSFSGAGLSSCNSANNFLQWNSSTGRFGCGTVSGSTGTGNIIATGDARYVKKSGDTMTGALTINVTGGNVSTVGLKVINTMSGAIVHAEKTLSTSGTLVFEGAASGSSLYLGTSLKGAGLSSCNSTNNALQWNSSTGRFGCTTITGGTSFSTGQVITIGDNRYVKKSGDTMTGALTINVTGGNVSTVGLKVINTLSGAIVHAEKSLTSSGTLVFEGAASGSSLYLGTSLKGAGLTDCSDGVLSKLLWSSATGRFSCGTDQSGASGISQSVADQRYVKKSGDTMTGALTINVTGGSPGTIGLKVLNTLSGAVIHAEKNLTSSGTLNIKGIATFQNNVNVAGTLSGKTLTIMNGNSYLLGNVGIGKSGTPNSKLEVAGTISGSTIYAASALRSSGSIVAEGTISGANLFVGTSIKGAGLTNCNSTNNALQWSSSTGRFSCGTITSGTSFSTGQVITIGDGRYVKKSGDTMTGALNIRPTVGMNTVGLNVAAVMSGRSLVIEGTGSVPLISTQLQYGTIVMGTGAYRTLTGAAIMEPQLNIRGRLTSGRIGSGSTRTHPYDVAVQGQYAYVVDQGSSLLQVFDIANPAHPTVVGSASTASSPANIRVQGKYAYIGLGGSTDLQVFDISNPSAPVVIDSYVNGSYSTMHTAVQGRYVYMLSTSKLLVLDFANPAAPVLVGSVSTSTNPRQIQVLGRYAYVTNGSTTNTLQIFDVGNPANPSSVGTVAAGSNPQGVAVQGRYAYVANDGSSTLGIYDISNPSSATAVATISTSSSPIDVKVQGRMAYVLAGSAIDMIDISNPLAPYKVGSVSLAGSSLPQFFAVSGRYAYVPDYGIQSLSVFDLGGAYIQALEAGSVKVSSLDVTAGIHGMDLSLAGGAAIAGSLVVTGNAVFGSGGLVSIGAISGNTLVVRGTTSGSVIHAESLLTSSGSIIATKDVVIHGAVLTRYGVQMMSGALITELSGFNDSIDLEANLAIHGITRMTTQGNLVHIGSIQGGAATLTAGGIFATKVDYTTGVSPISVAAGDLNGDGDPDIVAANYTSGTISVFLNNGSGTFASKVDYTTGSNPFSVAIGDLNGDGKPDIAVANYSSTTVSVFLNKGNGTFAAKVDYTTGSNPYSVAIGDLNGDGKSDIAVTNHTSNTVSVFLNKGDGTFASKVDYTTGSQPHSVAIGDINGDGKADLAVANQGSNSVSVFLNKGEGTFATKVDYTTGTFPNSVAIGDLNGDGKSDLAVANYTSSTVSAFLNTGTGSFATKVDYTTGSNPFSVAIGDLNGDGKADLAVADYGASTASVFLNTGTGSFAAKVDYTTGSSSHSIAISDFNGDGKNDLVVADYGASSISVLMNTITQSVRTFSGSGALTVVNKTRTGTGIYAFSSGSAVLALEAGTQSGSRTPDILFGYKGTFDTKITRTGTGALTFQSNTGVLLTLNTGMTNAKQDVFRIISQVNNGKGTLPNNLVFRVNGSGAVYSDAAFHSNGADYAEWFFDGNQNLQPGEIVCIDVTRNNAVKRCTRDGDNDVMGVVSTNPAFIGNTITGAEGLMPPGYVLVGLIGQVPTKVMVTGTGTIHPGDQLTAASTPGYARKARPGESTLGVALESIDHGTGTINVLISRRNSSLTVDTVSQKVLDTIASMKIGDEVQTMVAGAVQNLNVNDQVDAEVQKQLSAIQATNADIKTLQSQIDALKAQLSEIGSQKSVDSGQWSETGSAVDTGSGSTHYSLPTTHSSDLQASTLDLDSTLSVGGDTHLAGDLHLDGALIASDILVPGGIAIDGGETVNGNLAATTLHVNSGAEVDGALTINGDLRINSGSLLFGSGTLQLSDLVVQKALVVLGNITINGLATFLGDVSIKGELSVSNRQAGFALIPRTGTSVTVLFGSGGLRGTPVVTASPDAPILYAVNKTTQTGFTIQLATPAVTDIKFSWLALTTDMPGTQTGTVVADSSTVFPLASDNIPVSSDMAWNACIRGIAMFDASGKALSCSRYHDSYTWHQPDLKIDFLWNTDLNPPLLVVPDGFATQVTEDAAALRAAITGSSETDGADTSASSVSSDSSSSSISSTSSSSSTSSTSSLTIEPVTTDPTTAAASSTSSADSVSSATSVTGDAGSTASATSSVTSVPSVPSVTSSAASTAVTDTPSSTATTTDATATSSAPAATTDTTPSSAAPATAGTDTATQTQ